MNNSSDIQLYQKIDKMLGNLNMAKSRCLTADELIDKIKSEPLFPYNANKYFYIDRLSECDLKMEDTKKLLGLIQIILKESEKIPSKYRAGSDSFLKYLLRIVPEKLSHQIIIDLLSHKRKNRRIVAISLIKKKLLSNKDINKIIKLFEKVKDPSLLELVARQSNAINNYNLGNYLLKQIDNDYWRCRVIEGLLLNKVPKNLELARNYPVPFIHAIGRLHRDDLINEIEVFIDKYIADFDNLGLIIWALGKIKSKKNLVKIERIINKSNLIKKYGRI